MVAKDWKKFEEKYREIAISMISNPKFSTNDWFVNTNNAGVRVMQGENKDREWAISRSVGDLFSCKVFRHHDFAGVVAYSIFLLNNDIKQ